MYLHLLRANNYLAVELNITWFAFIHNFPAVCLYKHNFGHFTNSRALSERNARIKLLGALSAAADSNPLLQSPPAQKLIEIDASSCRS